MPIVSSSQPTIIRTTFTVWVNWRLKGEGEIAQNVLGNLRICSQASTSALLEHWDLIGPKIFTYEKRWQQSACHIMHSRSCLVMASGVSDFTRGSIFSALQWSLGGKLTDAVCVLPVLHSATEYLQNLGASVVEVSLPEMEEVKIAHTICILSEMRDFLHPDFNKHFQEMVSNSSLDQWQ